MHRAMTLAAVALALVIVGCGADKAGRVWTAQEMGSVGNLAQPECAVVERTTGGVFVSSMQTDEADYWADDGRGFISMLRPRGIPAAIEWKTGVEAQPLNSPKGMCVLGGMLYVADNTRVVAFPLFDDTRMTPVMGVTGERLNDMASDDTAVYVSDTAAGKVYRLDREGVRLVKAPAGVNGITFFRGRMYAVSWTEGEVYELDPSGEGEPRPFGLRGQFVTPDGIEVLDDGAILVSDLHGNRIALIAPDQKTVTTLIKVDWPADIGLDRARGLLYVPQFEKNRLTVYQLEKKRP
jgi:DNA-binding beta-propeller fold protein YncE